MTEQIITSDPNVEPEGHIANMEAKTEQLSNPQAKEVPLETPPNDRPDWLPEKFKSAEDLAKAYSELEKTNSKPTNDAGEVSNQEEAKAKAEELGIDFEAVSREYAETGGLSEDTLKDMESKGLPRDMVNGYITGEELRAAAYDSEVRDVVGGNDNYSAMTEWAKENLSEAEITTFNNLVGSGDSNTAKLAVQGLWKTYEPNHTHSPKNPVQGQTNTGNSGGYNSQHEMKTAMSDHRYGRDRSYTRDVENKVLRSGDLL